MIRAFLSLTALYIAATAACTADAAVVCPSSIAVVESLYTVDHDFAFSAPASLKTPATPRLLKALANEYAHCGAVQEQCLDADIWTGTNGWESDIPSQFAVVAEDATSAEVSVVSKMAQPAGSMLVATVKVSLVRASKTGCWAVDDLTLTDSSSLVQLLESTQ